jgi:hypothetical protein
VCIITCACGVLLSVCVLGGGVLHVNALHRIACAASAGQVWFWAHLVTPSSFLCVCRVPSEGRHAVSCVFAFNASISGSLSIHTWGGSFAAMLCCRVVVVFVRCILVALQCSSAVPKV